MELPAGGRACVLGVVARYVAVFGVGGTRVGKVEAVRVDAEGCTRGVWRDLQGAGMTCKEGRESDEREK